MGTLMEYRKNNNAYSMDRPPVSVIGIWDSGESVAQKGAFGVVRGRNGKNLGVSGIYNQIRTITPGCYGHNLRRRPVPTTLSTPPTMRVSRCPVRT